MDVKQKDIATEDIFKKTNLEPGNIPENIQVNNLGSSQVQVGTPNNDLENSEVVFKEVNEKAVNENKEEGLEIKDSNIHSMPDKFLKPEKKDKEKNWFLIIGIALVFVIILAVAGFAFFALRDKGNPDEILNIENQNHQNVNTNTNSSHEDESDLNTAMGRDEKRLNDILDIKNALAFYYDENTEYAINLSSLLDKYLIDLPKNPQPGGEAYYYQRQESGQNYILVFTLESGGSFGNLVLGEGRYELTPVGGIQIYQEEEEEDDENNNSANNENTNNVNVNVNVNVNNVNTGEELIIPPRGPDSDNDGLTNTEEILFGTKFDLPDSDFDGYVDGEEILALYDPNTADQRLVNNIDVVRIYNNDIYRYSVLYPAKWLAEEKTSEFDETNFYDDQNGDFFKIQIEENPQGLTLQKWYLYFSSGSQTGDLEYFQNPNVSGLKTKDGFNIYIANEDKIYIISYILVDIEELNYFRTFELLSQSFRFINQQAAEENLGDEGGGGDNET